MRGGVQVRARECFLRRASEKARAIGVEDRFVEESELHC